MLRDVYDLVTSPNLSKHCEESRLKTIVRLSKWTSSSVSLCMAPYFHPEIYVSFRVLPGPHRMCEPISCE